MSNSYKYRTNEKGFKEILGSSALANAMVKAGTPAVSEAARTAPRRTGNYAGGFTTIKPALVPAGRKGQLRAGAVIENDTAYARYVMDDTEFRSHMWVIAQRLGGGVVE